MPDKIVNHFVLADGSTAKYDATQLAGDVPEVVDIRTGFDGTVYESAGDAVRGQVGNLYSLLPFDELNLFDISKATSGYYIEPSTGNTAVVSDWSVSDYIDVEDMTAIVIMMGVYYKITNYAFYDMDKAYISGGQATAKDFNVNYAKYIDNYVQVPSNSKYLRVSTQTEILSGYMVVDSKNYYENMPYANASLLALNNELLADNSINKAKIKSAVVLEVGSTKKYRTLESALAIANGDANNSYIIKIDEGTYNVFSNVTPTAGYIGYDVANLELVGIGDKNKVIIYGYFPDTVEQSIRDTTSVFNVKGNFKCKNLTVSGKNIRYTIHDDYQTVSGCSVEYEDCTLKGESMLHNNVYGCGLWNGTKYKFDRCTFIGITSTFCYGFHTIANSNQAVTKADIVFNECSFITDNSYFCTFNSNHTKYRDSLTFNGCSFGGSIYPTGASCMVDIYGSGNSDLLIRDGTTAKDCKALFGDTTIKLQNTSGATITKGTVVKRDGWKAFATCGNNDIVLGVLLEDTAQGEFGSIQTSGILSNAFLSCSTGQSISNVNGVLTVGTTNVIGKCVFDNFVKLN